MNRRLFIAGLFGAAAAITYAEDLEPEPPAPAVPPTTSQWWRHYNYCYSAALRQQLPSDMELRADRNFRCVNIAWQATQGAVAELYIGEKQTFDARAILPPLSYPQTWRLRPELFIPAGARIRIKLTNSPDALFSDVTLALIGLQEISEDELMLLRSQTMDAEFSDEDAE